MEPRTCVRAVISKGFSANALSSTCRRNCSSKKWTARRPAWGMSAVNDSQSRAPLRREHGLVRYTALFGRTAATARNAAPSVVSLPN